MMIEYEDMVRADALTAHFGARLLRAIDDQDRPVYLWALDGIDDDPEDLVSRESKYRSLAAFMRFMAGTLDIARVAGVVIEDGYVQIEVPEMASWPARIVLGGDDE